MRKRRTTIFLLILLCGSAALLGYAVLPYLAPTVVIRHDPSYRRVVLAISRGVGSETLSVMRDRMRSADEQDFATLLKLVSELEDPWERQCAIELLLQTPDPCRIPPAVVHRTLTDPDEHVALWSAILLGRIGSKASVSHLFTALADKRPRVVLSSAEALLAIHAGDPELPEVKKKIAELTKGVLEPREPESRPEVEDR